MSEMEAASLGGKVLAPPGAVLVLAEWTAQPSPGGKPLYQAPLHLHEEDEAWYVLHGELKIRAGNEILEVKAGGAVVVPGGTAHTYWNPGAEPARYLLVMGARTYALIQAIHATADRGKDNLGRIFEEHGGRLLE